MRTVWALSKLMIKEAFRKKDFYVVFVLIALILIYAGQLQFYNIGNVVRYLREIGLALIFLFSVLLTVPLAARQYPSESQNRTLPILMAKPVARWEFIFGKFTGACLAGISCFTIFFSFFMMITLTKTDAYSPIIMVQTLYCYSLNLILLSSMAIAFSFCLTYSANVAVTVTFYFLMDIYGAHLKQMSQNLIWPLKGLGNACYYLLPHFEFFDLRQRFIHEWNPISLQLTGFLTLYAGVYTFFFLILAWWQFRRRFV